MHPTSFFLGGIAALLLTACGGEASAPVAPGEIRVTADHIPAPRPGAAVAAGYLRLEAGTDDALIGATSPAARAVEIHEMSMAGGRMTMRPVPRLELQAGDEVKLNPNGMHLMFIDLDPAFASATSVEVTLLFASAPPQTVTLPLRAR